MYICIYICIWYMIYVWKCIGVWYSVVYYSIVQYSTSVYLPASSLLDEIGLDCSTDKESRTEYTMFLPLLTTSPSSNRNFRSCCPVPNRWRVRRGQGQDLRGVWASGTHAKIIPERDAYVDVYVCSCVCVDVDVYVILYMYHGFEFVRAWMVFVSRVSALG